EQNCFNDDSRHATRACSLVKLCKGKAGLSSYIEAKTPAYIPEWPGDRTREGENLMRTALYQQIPGAPEAPKYL
ncbi:hypothetical protein ACSTLK_23780, partial [Vibrio parahaemolyticus]